MTGSVRIAFLGNDAWSVPSLEALTRSAHELAVVVTSIPRPARRGNRLVPTPVAEAAERLRLPLVQVPTVRDGEGLARLEAASADVLAVVAYGELLPPSLLRLPRLAPVNLHFSLLPRLRGASPVQTALLLGLDRTGVSTIVMDEGLDTGPVIAQREVAIDAEDDASALGARLADVGAETLIESVELLAEGGANPRRQDEALATYAPKLGHDDRLLDWERPAPELVNRCRALSPEPGALTSFRGSPLKVFRAEALEATGEAGRIAAVSSDGLVVATGSGGFRPLAVAPAGRRPMSGADFAHGFRPEVGERLG